MERSQKSKEFVLLGGSGDLAREKLYPALFDVFDSQTDIRYLGYARTPLTEAAYRDLVRESVLKKNPHANPDQLRLFVDRFTYHTGSYDATGLAQLTPGHTEVFRYYYLALPSSYELLQHVVTGLAAHRLNENSLIVLEKPFGTNRTSAKKLNTLLLKHFSEEQIYRIDHYLAKDLVQDMLALRFANPIFHPIWNSRYIESITISIKESEGIRGRGQYYDQAGVIRDMIQNHALQLLAFTLMRQPESFSAQAIHEEKMVIFKKLCLFQNGGLQALTIGQYTGYRNEEHVTPHSLTETYASLVTEVDLPEWRGVPIRIESGKKLDKRTTDIIITFKKTASTLWDRIGCDVQPNQIRINVQPHNDIHLTLNSEFSPAEKCALPTTLHFGFKDNQFLLKDPYENALRDLFLHDRSIFIGSEEILLAWQFIDSVQDLLAPVRAEHLRQYGSEKDLSD